MSPLFDGFLDDAAVFPPGSLPLTAALPAYFAHKESSYADLVGAFVLAARDLGALREVTADMPVGSLPLSVTVPLPDVARAVAAAAAIPAAVLVSVEVAVPDGLAAEEVVPLLGSALGSTAPVVYVEVPRDERRMLLVRALSGTGWRAKLRTGGVRADLYPDERELAESVHAAVAAGVPFKATAGLHHALRNTDPETGFEQHGFLNLLLATARALAGADVDDLAAVLADRDAARVSAAVREVAPDRREVAPDRREVGADRREVTPDDREVTPDDREVDADRREVMSDVRRSFCSFGTCSIIEPVEELRALGLIR